MVLFIGKLNYCISRSYDSLQKYCAMNISLNVDGLIGECLEELHEVQSQLIRMKTDFDNIQIMIAIGLSFIVCFFELAVLLCTFFCNPSERFYSQLFLVIVIKGKKVKTYNLQF